MNWQKCIKWKHAHWNRPFGETSSDFLLSRSFSEAKPTDFMFELTEEEMKNLTSQFVTSSWGGTRHQSFAFTEQGVAMLSSVLKSKIAIHVNISIMRAFVMMRQWALTHQELSKRLDAIEQQYGQKFSDIEQVLNFLIQKDQKQAQQQQRDRIGFKK